MRMMTCAHCWGSRTEPTPTTGGPCGVCGGVGLVEDKPLSPNFMLSEFLASQTAVRRCIPNDLPSPDYLDRLRQLCVDLLEPVRAALGPLRITSGYRGPELNAAIGGSSPTSMHPRAWAADFNPVTAGITRKKVIDFVVASDLPFDQVIWEGTWCHIGRLSPTGEVRRQALMMFPRAGAGPAYSPWDPTDARVLAGA